MKQKSKKLMDPEFRDTLTKCIMEILNNASFLSQLIVRQELVETEEVFALATDGTHIYYNPKTLRAFQIPTYGLKFMLAHEALHYVQKGHIRIKNILGKNEVSQEMAALFNIAQDLAINDILVSDGWKYYNHPSISPILPGRGDYRNFPKHKDAEYYMALLMQDRQMEQKQQQESESGDNDEKEEKENEDEEQDSGSGEGEEEQGDGGGGGEDGEGSEDGDDGDSEEEGDEEGGGSSEADGDGPDGGGRDSGNDGKRGGADSEERDGNGPSRGSGGKESAKERKEKLEALAERAREYGATDLLPAVEEDTEQEGDVDQAIALSLGFGCGAHQNSALLMAVRGEIKPPKIPWRRQLQQYMTAKEKSTPTFTRPNRRRTGGEFIFPSRNNPTLAKTVLVCDTSGSMGYLLSAIASEIYSLVGTFPNAEFTIICNDSVVRHVVEVSKGKPLPPFDDWKWKGLGGTDMNPGFLEAERRNPSLIICATDWDYGFLGFPPRPRQPVVWVIPKTAIDRLPVGVKPPYGNVVVIDDKEILEEQLRKYRSNK